MTKFLSENVVERLVGPRDALESMRALFKAMDQGSVDNAIRSRVRLERASFHSLPASCRTLNRSSLKFYSATRDRMQSWLTLFSADGEMLSMMEANTLGQLRTAAVSILAAKLKLGTTVQKPKIAIIGNGYQAWGHAKAIAAEFPDAAVKISGRTLERAENFAKQCRETLRLDAHAVASAKEACASAELIITTTTSSQPVLDLDDIGPAKLIVAMGANALSRRELSPKLVSSAVDTVVDCLEVARAEGGNLISPIENGKLSWAGVHELSQYVSGRRELAKTGLTIFFSHGLAAEDLYLASLVYDRAVEEGTSLPTLPTQ